MSRADARQPNELRSLKCRRGELYQASGSARWSHGDTSVLASVFVPALTSNPEADEEAILDISFYITKIDIGEKEAEMKQLLHGALRPMLLLKSFPRCFVKLDIQVLYGDGALLSCAFNAACNALMDAGIPMISQWSSVTLALTTDNTIYIDPTKSEEEAAQAVVSATFPAYRQMTGEDALFEIRVEEAPICCYMTGALSPEKLLSYLDICRAGCVKICQFSCDSAEKYLKHLRD